MPIDVHPDGGFTITGPNEIEWARRITVKHALALEVKTGLKHRANMFRLAKDIVLAHGVTPKGTKKGVLAQMEELYPAR
jgi:hypothetical protein